MPQLRLFPLHLVLFPGMPLGLHIFEERYKQMINECLRNGEPFGVVAIRHGSDVGDPLPDIFEVGTAAHILQVEPLEGGRMNIVGVGQARFRIQCLHTDRPYLYADVEYLHLRDQRAPSLPPLMERVGLLVHRYLDVLRQADLVKGGGQNKPWSRKILCRHFCAIWQNCIVVNCHLREYYFPHLPMNRCPFPTTDTIQSR